MGGIRRAYVYVYVYVYVYGWMIRSIYKNDGNVVDTHVRNKQYAA